jgi:predicted ATPase
LAGLESTVEAATVVTLVGPGGVGKTRLAVEFARGRLPAFPDGVWVVDLSPVGSPDRVASEVAAAFGVTAGAGDQVRLLTEQVGDRSVLLVLDNCEHVIDAVADLVGRVVGACPAVKVVCTSREPLGVAAEALVVVEPLDGPDAVALFVDRARAVDPGFVAAPADLDVLATVCARLDNLPLAIELAAPWVRVVALPDLFTVAGRLDVGPATRRDLPARQRTMRATVEWSYGRLTDDQRTLLRRLAAFSGTFDLPAVSAVCGEPPLDATQCPPLIAQLVERSMVSTVRAPAGSVRYRLLETIRDLAAARLDASGEVAALRGRHFGYYLSLAFNLPGPLM